MELAIVAITALFAAGLTFFSGFGLGTILLPVLALFLPAELAVAGTGVVHLANNLFKLALMGRHADRSIAIRFGVPAVLAALAGAWLLGRVAALPAVASWGAAGRVFDITPLGLAIASVVVFFAAFDLVPRLRGWRVPSRWMPVGGALSGFFGGLSGHQGALRSAFLTKAGLTKEGFIGTGVVIACVVDLTRLGVYSGMLGRSMESPGVEWARLGPILAVGCIAALAGSLVGARLVRKITIDAVRWIVGAGLMLLGAAMGAGVI